MGQSNTRSVRVQRSAAGEGTSLAQWLLDAMARWKERGRGDERRLQLVETLPLNGKGRLMLVRCGGKEYLVGGGVDSLETILCVGERESCGVLQQGMEL